jgi:hypothetical protein
MSVPVFFTPEAIAELGNCLYADGGQQKNCPSNAFRKNLGDPAPDVLSTWFATADDINDFVNGIKPPRQPIVNFPSYLTKTLPTATSAESYAVLHSDDKARLMFLDTMGVTTLDFAKMQDPSQMAALKASAEKTVVDYFLQRDPERVKRYLKEEEITAISKTWELYNASKFLHKSPQEVTKALASLGPVPAPAPAPAASQSWSPAYNAEKLEKKSPVDQATKERKQKKKSERSNP